MYLSKRCAMPLLDVRPLHRQHRVGQHQNVKAAVERGAKHLQKFWIEKRLAAREADFARAECLGFVQKYNRFGSLICRQGGR